MEDVYQTLGGAIDLWKLPYSTDNEDIDATEFWLDHASDKIEVKHRSVSKAERSEWLAARTGGHPGAKKSLLARFVWLVADGKNKTVNLSEDAQKVLRKAFGLKLAHGFFKTFITGVMALPRVKTAKEDRRAYAFCYGPKLAAIWSHARLLNDEHGAAGEGISEGIIYARADPKHNTAEDQKPMLQAFLNQIPLNPHLCRSSAFPAYLFSLLLGKQIDETQSQIREAVRKVETRTGFHNFASRLEMPNPAELLSLSAETSGYATKLASVERKSKMVENLLKFILNTVTEDKSYFVASGIPTQVSASGLDQFSLLKHNVEVLQERLSMQTLDTQYTLSRVQIQIEADDNINNYEIATSNFKIAASSFKLAAATHTIAYNSYRDSSSMKTLAVVTMFFLPGSFISALFSAPLFAWDELDIWDFSYIGVRTTPQFIMYWAITIPLTVLTFVCYFLWIIHQKKKRLDKATEEPERPQMDTESTAEIPTVPLRASSDAERYKISRRRMTMVRVKDVRT